MKTIIDFIKKYLSPITILGLCALGLFESPIPFIGYRVGTSLTLVAIAFFYIFFEMPKTWSWIKSGVKSLFKKS